MDGCLNIKKYTIQSAKLPVLMLSCQPVIQSSGHLVIWSSGQKVIRLVQSSSHPIIQKSCHPLIFNIATDEQTNGHTTLRTSTGSASQTITIKGSYLDIYMLQLSGVLLSGVWLLQSVTGLRRSHF